MAAVAQFNHRTSSQFTNLQCRTSYRVIGFLAFSYQYRIEDVNRPALTLSHFVGGVALMSLRLSASLQSARPTLLTPLILNVDKVRLEVSAATNLMKQIGSLQYWLVYRGIEAWLECSSNSANVLLSYSTLQCGVGTTGGFMTPDFQSHVVYCTVVNRTVLSAAVGLLSSCAWINIDR